jgi:hypothetical protein
LQFRQLKVPQDESAAGYISIDSELWRGISFNRTGGIVERSGQKGEEAK